MSNEHVLLAEPQVTEDPCVPNPCGRYSDCTNNNGSPRCACQEGYTGSPPNCRPECLLSSDCSPHLACIRQKCVDPCVGICGSNAICKVMNHRSICSCPPDFTGDPFVSCNKQAGRKFGNPIYHKCVFNLCSSPIFQFQNCVLTIFSNIVKTFFHAREISVFKKLVFKYLN